MESITKLRLKDIAIKEPIPEFPKERKLELSDITGANPRLGTLLGNFSKYSDFNLLSLWGYNTEDDLRLSQCNGNMVFKMRHYITNQPFYAFCGEIDVNSSVENVFHYLKQDDKPAVLDLVPQEIIDKLDREKYIIQEDPKNFDYIYKVDELATLQGGRNEKVRNFRNRFRAMYPAVQGRILNLEDKTVKDDMLHVFDEWGKMKEGDATTERTALQRTITCASQLDNILPIGLYDNDQLIGFMICDMTEDGWAQGHFAKADIKYKGIYSYLYHTVAKELDARGIHYLNLEQDLGILGLTIAKKQMNPIFFLKKYTVSPK